MTSSSIIDDLVEALSVTDSLTGACESLLRSAVQMLDADVAGLLTWTDGDTPARLASTDSVQIERICSHPGGPACGAHELDGDHVTVSDLATEHRWPEWARSLADEGYRSMQMIVLPSLAHRPLTLDLYARRPHAFDASDRAHAVDAVRLAAMLLNRVERAEDLRAALHSRALIAQAQGLFMERFTLTSEQAMAYLRRLSQDQQVKVRDLAQRVVDASDQDTPGSP